MSLARLGHRATLALFDRRRESIWTRAQKSMCSYSRARWQGESLLRGHRDEDSSRTAATCSNRPPGEPGESKEGRILGGGYFSEGAKSCQVFLALATGARWPDCCSRSHRWRKARRRARPFSVLPFWCSRLRGSPLRHLVPASRNGRCASSSHRAPHPTHQSTTS